MAEYTISIDADVSDVLAGFAKIGKAAQQSGTEASKGLGDPLTAVNSKIGAVLQELKKIAQLKASPQVDAQQLKEAESRAAGLREELKRLNQEKASLKVSTPGLSESADGFRLLDGVVQGVAFSLSNAVVSGAGQALNAIGGLVNAYAQLDTVIRQAAAASGGPGDYDKLAATIDRVGIDAAGTSEQVAGLSLELARGGMTADQQAKALAGIVRGAEATATSYDRMGQIVSATLTSFGLDAGQTTRVVDALVQGANASATDVSGLGEAFKLSAPAAKLLGVNVEGLATAVGLFTNAGITASEAGTALRNGLSQLAQAAPKNGQQLQGLTGQAKVAADAVRQLGLDIYTASGQLKPMETVLLQVKRAMTGMTAGEQTNLASKLFGGLDDAAKWLAVIGQSEEKIKAMAASMANSSGATDRNRDAMQGFQLTMQQLTGTLDSLGKNVGKVAATALLPLVQAANSVVGAVSGLPGPVKDAGIALGLLTGGVVSATAAWVVFQRVIQMGAVQTAATEIGSLAVKLGGTLKAGLDAAIAAWPGFIAQVRLASTAQYGLIASLQAAAAAIKAQFIAAMEGAKASIIGFIGYLRSASFAQFIAGARAAVVALAPMAAAIGALIGAVLIYRQTVAGSDEVQQKFAGSQEEMKAAADKLNKSLGIVGAGLEDAKKSADNARNGFVSFWNSLREPMALRELSIQVLQFQAGWEKVVQSARLYNRELRLGNVTGLTGDKATQGVASIEALRAAADATDKRAASLREFADAEEAAGRFQTAGSASAKANQLAKEAEGYRLVASQLNDRLSAAAREVNMTPEQLQALEARRRAEEALNKVIAEAPVRQVDQQIAVGQALLGISKALGEADQSRLSIAKAQLEFELKQAQARGAGQGELEAIQLRIAANERTALQLKLKYLDDEQKAQEKLLDLQQRKALLSANEAVRQANVGVADAQRELEKTKAKGFGTGTDQNAEAQAGIDRANAELVAAKESLSLLLQTQPLERQSAQIQAQVARAAIEARMAQEGYGTAAKGSAAAIATQARAQQRVAELAEVSRKVEREVSQQRLANAQALSSALSDIGALEQSRFSVARSRMEFELQSTQDRFGKEAAAIQKQGDDALKVAEERATAEEEQARRNGKSEQVLAAIRQRNENNIAQIKNRNAVDAANIAQKSEAESSAIKKRIADQDRAALDARYQQLQREQQLELVILGIKQQQQLRDAQSGIRIAQLDLRAANATLSAALKTGNQDEIEKADALVQKQEIILAGKREELGLIAQGQAVERASVLLKQGAADNAIRAEQAAKGYAVAQDNSGSAAQAVLTINQAIAGVLQGNASLSGAMSGNFGTAATSSTTISSQMDIVASSTGQAATAAQAFYGWLERASRLPGARWAGGPVEAGGEYRINELGQEAFLSAGRISLIDATPNSIWRAPADGVVIPAGITARLQGAAMPAAGGGTAGLAELAIEVGNLRQEVGNLARRDWSVKVTQRTGPTGSQVLRTLLS